MFLMFNILVVFGLVFGRVLGYLTKEEIVKGKDYFLLFEKILLIILAVSVFKFNLYFLIGLILYFIIRKVSLFLGLGVAVSSFLSLEFGLFFASLVFLYLLIYSRSLSVKNIGVNFLLFIIPFVLVESFIKPNLNIFLAIASGGVIGPVAQLGRATVKKLKLL